MKKSLKAILIVTLLLLGIAAVTVGLTVRGRFINGYYLDFEVNEDRKTCTVTKCLPLGAEKIVIPETLGGYQVSEIGAYAFANRASLTDIILPSTIQKIGQGAFYECEGLTEITVPNSVTSIGSYAFYHCNGLTDIVLSESVTSIGARVFEGCENMTEASVPTVAINALPAQSITSLTVNSGHSIGSRAFQNFKNLTDIVISPSVEEVADDAFYGCIGVTSAIVPTSACSAIPKSNLTHVVINGGTHIAERTFAHANNLISITLPKTLESIGAMAFSNCYRLVEIYNFSPLTITVGDASHGGIGLYALSICTSPEEKSKVWVSDDGYICYSDDKTSYLLGSTGSNTDLHLPEKIGGKSYVIREYAFFMMGNIESVTLPEGVLGIEDNAFAFCSSITEIVFPDSLISIGSNVFVECDRLERISLGKGISFLGTFAFNDCNSLKEVSFQGTVAEWAKVTQGYYWIYYTDGKVALK